MNPMVVFFVSYGIMALAVTIQWLVYRHLYTGRVEGTVVAFEEDINRSNGESVKKYYPVVEFTVKEENYHVVIYDSTPRSRQNIGPADICYAPDNPKRCQLSYRLSKKQLVTSLVLAAFVAGLFSVALSLSSEKH